MQSRQVGLELAKGWRGVREKPDLLVVPFPARCQPGVRIERRAARTWGPTGGDAVMIDPDLQHREAPDKRAVMRRVWRCGCCPYEVRRIAGGGDSREARDLLGQGLLEPHAWRCRKREAILGMGAMLDEGPLSGREPAGRSDVQRDRLLRRPQRTRHRNLPSAADQGRRKGERTRCDARFAGNQFSGCGAVDIRFASGKVAVRGEPVGGTGEEPAKGGATLEDHQLAKDPHRVQMCEQEILGNVEHGNPRIETRCGRDVSLHPA